MYFISYESDLPGFSTGLSLDYSTFFAIFTQHV